ncbi:hypothetical protein BGX28_005240 [Mortierella sp. GBA30]|nr:hypothetical protein BGX28_005240 [Mortierella sp. GBA30]
MPFVIGANNADEFNKYLINVVVVTASVAWLFLLFVKSIDQKVYKYWKPFSVAMTLQLFFVTLRNLSTMMLSSGFAIPCRWVAVIGGVIYQFFAISAECAMLIRCRSFTRYPKMVTYLTIPTWIIRLGLCLWLVTTIQGPDNQPGFICMTTMNYNLSAIMQYIKIATEVIILVFFLERVIALHRGSSGIADSNHNHWRRLALINAGITFLVILFEILVGQITVYLTDYLFLTYSMVNLIQANLVVFIVEDTKSVFKKRAASSNNASRQQGNHSNHSQRDYNEDHTVSYAEGVAAAKASRLHESSALGSQHSQHMNMNGAQQPWSLTMRAPSAMPETIPVQYSPQERPSSSFYDFGPVDQKNSHHGPNRLWDVDAESQDTIDGSQRWRHNKAEDEIPMTLAKSREDAQNQRR